MWVKHTRAAVAVSALAVGCGRDTGDASRRVEQCERGMRQALRRESRGEAIRGYLHECAPLFHDARCQAGLRKRSGDASNDWLAGAISSCGKAYCSALGSGAPNACKGETPAVPEAADKAWYDLAGAILKHEHSPELGGAVLAFVRFFAGLDQRFPPRHAPHHVTNEDVERCEHGAERSATSPTRDEAMRVYYEACAPLYEGDCRAAFERAAAAKNPAALLPVVLLSCRKPYCAWIPASEASVCNGEFVPIPEAIAPAWRELSDAIARLDGHNRTTLPDRVTQ